MNNDWKPPWMGFKADITPVTGPNRPFPCVFEMIKIQNSSIKTAAFYDWDWLAFLMNKGNPGQLDTDYFCTPREESDMSLCDRYITNNVSSHLTKMFQLTGQKSYTFAYLGNLDETGHKYGWCGTHYKQEVGVIDHYVDEIMDIIESQGVMNRTLIILSADHGGEGRGHGFQDNNCLLIPMFIRGPMVLKNHKFKMAVRNMDIVPTALYALGLRPSVWWTGRVMTEAYGDVMYNHIPDSESIKLIDITGHLGDEIGTNEAFCYHVQTHVFVIYFAFFFFIFIR